VKCIKSSRNCPGYERERVFVHSDVKREADRGRYHIKHPTLDRKHLSPNASYLENYEASLERSSLVDNDDKVEGSTPLDYSHSLVSGSLRRQILSLYFAQYQSSSRTGAVDVRSWILAIPSIPSPTQALETAAYALSLARLGTTFGSKDLIQESLKLYTRSLRNIQLALWNPKLMYSDETLGACMLLSMYEAFQCPNNSSAAFLNHYKGSAKLILLRGPGAHIDGMAHSIFQWFRFIDVRPLAAVM
jgi:transcription factor-like protein